MREVLDPCRVPLLVKLADQVHQGALQLQPFWLWRIAMDLGWFACDEIVRKRARPVHNDKGAAPYPPPRDLLARVPYWAALPESWPQPRARVCRLCRHARCYTRARGTMRLGFAFLADAAVASPDGKIGVLGGNFDTLYVRQQLPATHPTMTLVINLRATPAECGHAHRMRVEFWDPDGERVLEPMELSFTPPRDARNPHRPVSLNLISVLQNVTIPRLGDYAFHILVDDLEVGDVPFWVEAVPPGPEPDAPENL